MIVLYREILGRYPTYEELRSRSDRLKLEVEPAREATALYNSLEHRVLVAQGLAPVVTLGQAFADALRIGRLFGLIPLGPVRLLP